MENEMKKILLAIALLSVAEINARVENKSGIYTPTILTPKAVMTQLIMPNNSETVSYAIPFNLQRYVKTKLVKTKRGAIYRQFTFNAPVGTLIPMIQLIINKKTGSINSEISTFKVKPNQQPTLITSTDPIKLPASVATGIEDPTRTSYTVSSKYKDMVKLSYVSGATDIPGAPNEAFYYLQVSPLAKEGTLIPVLQKKSTMKHTLEQTYVILRVEEPEKDYVEKEK
jgi:hypothetical protein